MGLISVYMFNLLCAMVPCQGTQPPPEAYIASPSSTNEVRVEPRQKRLLWNMGDMSAGSENFLRDLIGFRSGRQSSIFGRVDENTIDSEKFPTVWTETGAIEGYFMGTMKGRKISAFEGIPYAEAPVGKLRFKPPVPKTRWKRTLSAKKPGSVCLQGHPQNFFRVTGSDDCLYMNIYTPEIAVYTKKHPKLPVIFFIHGGSFWYGAGSEYGPAYLLDQDVILITFNYRLGALGFLSNGDSIIPGNYGLKDQAEALKWVYENIQEFGGDKNRITIMGQSAGGVSAHLHLISNKTSKYLHGGVSLSGSGFGHWPIVPRKRIKNFTSKLAKRLGCPTDSSESTLTCLKSRNPSWIIAAQQHLFDWIVPFHPLVMFAPVIEDESPTAFLTQTPEEAYGNGSVAEIPWIFGMTKQEGHFETYLIKLFMQAATVTLNPKSVLPTILDYSYNTEGSKRALITDKILEYYNVTSDTSKIMDQVSEMYTDRFFSGPLEKAIRAHSEVAKTYSYVFGYKGKYNLGTLFGVPENEWGISHTEDLFYYFNSSSYLPGLKKKDVEYELSEIMTTVLANFATKREPLFTDSAKQDMKFWSESVNTVTKTNTTIPLEYLSYSQNIKMIKNPFHERIKFWNSLNFDNGSKRL